ncbi:MULTISPECIES: lysine--tRNA ligase [Micromonospora]|uniref:Lysine--tRNA ligase n=1 Tax=Micromonospora chalcea TaxID=1874 RepID=A0ABX9XUY8_MICCH|nr:MULTISPECIES: lysine--tRNA ligase [Micromonospora]EWM67123.1 lysine--tRNA ligase [Micromonospora sp. M42]MBC8993928.1 lysine--tRNA ligase [Micromonospora chalcea]MBQ1062035.1 lysine--tRNA ligase [Micromonospora sp. C41]MBQ1068587.1 lysine--tRNA ligase [Micromonospora sp. D75]MCK1810175.1 lysine--tRNA ligase [Micromonospora sp. R42106]
MTEQNALPADPADDLPEQMKVRREKRDRMLAEGTEPYPVGFPRTTTLAQLRERYADLPTDTATGDRASVTGRVIFIRNTGKLCFATLRDGDGTELQAMLSLDRVGPERLADWKRLVDLGDHVGVTGEVITSRRGELSVLAEEWAVTAKALRPLPVAHKPLSEESRVRQRYVDLVVRPQARQMVRTRATAVRSLRDTLHGQDFIEVETPMLQLLHGGAAARPFVTHSNALDTDLYLRIAPELFLKRAVVGGVDRVFEINRNFRNEGIDSSHSPEFAMLEAYQAYGDYDTMAELTRNLVQQAAIAVAGSTVVTHADGREFDLGGEWRSVTLFGVLSEALGEEVTVRTERARLVEYADKVGLSVDPKWGPGKLAEELFEELVVPSLQAPTFVRDYPEETSPLTRAHRSEPGLAEKWDLYVLGFELGTAYSELVDPVVQRDRLVAQAQLAARGDDEAMRLDEDFLRAMEYGMPPSGGMGMGIDRLLMALTGLGIRETILFPLVRPE